MRTEFPAWLMHEKKQQTYTKMTTWKDVNNIMETFGMPVPMFQPFQHEHTRSDQGPDRRSRPMLSPLADDLC